MPYAQTAKALSRVLSQGRSLSEVLSDPAISDHPQAAKIKAWCYESLRWGHRLLPLVQKDYQARKGKKGAWLESLLLISAWQLFINGHAEHAVVNESVKAATKLNASWAKGLINAVLRKWLRENPLEAEGLSPQKQAVREWSHPNWMILRLKNDWPDSWQEILQAGNNKAPMWLRCNLSEQREFLQRSEYQQLLKKNEVASHIIEKSPQSAILLDKPVSVDDLPGFNKGQVSVQDAAAQWVAEVLPFGGNKTLDACSSPGGKAAHYLEKYPDQQLMALEVDEKRVELIRSTRARLGLKINIWQADASAPDSWWDGQHFDQILVDAPCSGSGVIRRHPDIKFLRRESDIQNLVDLQKSILDATWTTLKPGGHLLYTTCSVYKDENHHQIEKFLARTDDAQCIEVEGPPGIQSPFGMQLIPGTNDMDGFFYALLKKRL